MPKSEHGDATQYVSRVEAPPIKVSLKRRKPKKPVNVNTGTYPTIIPIPFRGGYIKIQGLPHDLTNDEAVRICKIISAFVSQDITNLKKHSSGL